MKAVSPLAGRPARGGLAVEEDALLRAIVERPQEADQTWLVLADWLDEHDRATQAELIRLQHQPSWRPDLDVTARHARIVELLVAGVRPCVPARVNSLGMRFVWVPPGAFLMGSPPEEPQRDSDEPQHHVTLTRGCWMSETTVTQPQWQAIMDRDPSHWSGPDRPADHVGFRDCEEFCRRLTARDGLAYRLPTEAEWEYACRAGTTTPFFWGDTITTDLANYDGTYVYGRSGAVAGGGVYRQETVDVFHFPPNAWGLYQMHGNVMEWCSDPWGPYPDGPAIDPVGTTANPARVLRGGSWYLYPWNCRSANRNSGNSDSGGGNTGCRVCFTAEG
jgi:uncharacterized protein (TIGR02996 family)